MQWSPGIDWWVIIILIGVLCVMVAIIFVNYRYKLDLGDFLLFPGFVIVNLVWILPFYIGASPNYFTIFAPRIAQAALADTNLPRASSEPPAIPWNRAIAAFSGSRVMIDGWQPVALVEGYSAWYADGYASNQASAAWRNLIQSGAMKGLAATWIAQMPAQTAPGTQYCATAIPLTATQQAAVAAIPQAIAFVPNASWDTADLNNSGWNNSADALYVLWEKEG